MAMAMAKTDSESAAVEVAVWTPFGCALWCIADGRVVVCVRARDLNCKYQNY